MGVLNKRNVRVAVGLYCLLWIVTALWGNVDVDRQFDREFNYGYKDFSEERIELTRINSFFVKDLMDPRNKGLVPTNGRFRYRSHGIAIAPFVIVDQIGTVFASLGGLGALRLNVWLFGFTKWWVIQGYWDV